MKREILLSPRLTHRDIADGIREVYRLDPMKAEHKVGSFYGWLFRRREEAHDRLVSR